MQSEHPCGHEVTGGHCAGADVVEAGALVTLAELVGEEEKVVAHREPHPRRRGAERPRVGQHARIKGHQ